MAKITIRRMRESDLTSASELAMLANPHAVKKEHSRGILRELKENPRLSFVAVDNGSVIGYALSEVRDNGEAVLEDIAVAENHQKKGVGSLLLSKTMKALKLENARIVFAEVHYKCAPAIPFYYNHGFRISGFHQDYFGIGHDAIVLKRVL